jgi:hypothetical protein
VWERDEKKDRDGRSGPWIRGANKVKKESFQLLWRHQPNENQGESCPLTKHQTRTVPFEKTSIVPVLTPRVYFRMHMKTTKMIFFS